MSIHRSAELAVSHTAASLSGLGPKLATTDGTTARRVRRAVDVTVSAAVLLLGLPIVAIVAIAVRLDTPGPALFQQVRVGRHGRHFTFYKIRGMYVDAAERWPEFYAYSYDRAEIARLRFHPEHDPRVTRVGRVIRRTSLDEVLNFYNVLKGDMSIVGPRPEIPEMLPYYGPAAGALLSIKPGVTSLAKVSGRDGLDFASTLRLDVEYVQRRSLLLDFKIMLWTVATVVLRRGVLPG